LAVVTDFPLSAIFGWLMVMMTLLDGCGLS
jgi:hypothetical protein